MFALFLTFPFHISVTFPLSTCQKPSASGVAVQTSVWRRHIMMFRLRSHLFSHHVLVVGQVNCRRNSSAARIICLYHMSTWCVLNAYSIIFKYDSSHIFQHFFHMLAESSLFSNKRRSLFLLSFPLSSRVMFIQLWGHFTCLAHWMDGKKSLVCEWLFGQLALLMVCGEDDR